MPKKKAKRKTRRRNWTYHDKIIAVKSVTALQKAIDEAGKSSKHHVRIEHLCTIKGVPWILLGWSELE